MNKKILVLGKGYLGKEFERQGYEVWGKDCPWMVQCTGGSYYYFYDHLDSYDVIINCISKCNTRWCEDNKNFDMVIDANAKIPKDLSDYCKEKNKKFVHISTGCLYDNDETPNKETDYISAHCNYTVSKFIGERHCDYERDLILRPRLLFNDELTDKNLLYRMLKFNKFVNNKLDSFTHIGMLVEATTALIKADQTGVFNVAHEGATTIYGLSTWLGIKDAKPTTIEEVRKNSHIYLVNNVMDITKLKQFYQPSRLDEAVKSCYNILNEANKL